MAPKKIVMTPWTVIKRSQLPAEWLEEPSAEVVNKWATKLACQPADLTIVPVVSMPQCTISECYLRWLDHGHATGRLAPSSDEAAVMLENVNEWIVTYETSLTQWSEEFLAAGHPPLRFMAHIGFRK